MKLRLSCGTPYIFDKDGWTGGADNKGRFASSVQLPKSTAPPKAAELTDCILQTCESFVDILQSIILRSCIEVRDDRTYLLIKPFQNGENLAFDKPKCRC